MSITLVENIARLRKEKRWTQAELGEKLGVSNQAVSKWEQGMSLPDILLLPLMASTFGCSIDELFLGAGTVTPKAAPPDSQDPLPWEDDGVIRGVVYEGRSMLQAADMNGSFTFEIRGEAKNVKSECGIVVHGDVSGGCVAEGDISVEGCVSGGCNAGGDVTVSESFSGGANVSGSVAVGGCFSGGCNINGDLTVGGNHSGDIISDGTITVVGYVEAERIRGNVVCHTLKCDDVRGTVTVESPADP